MRKYIIIVLLAYCKVYADAPKSSDIVRQLVEGDPSSKHTILLAGLPEGSFVFVRRKSEHFASIKLYDCKIAIPGLERGFTCFVGPAGATVVTDSPKGLAALIANAAKVDFRHSDPAAYVNDIMAMYKPRYSRLTDGDYSEMQASFKRFQMGIYVNRGTVVSIFDDGTSFSMLEWRRDGEDIICITSALSRNEAFTVVENVRLSKVLRPMSPHD